MEEAIAKTEQCRDILQQDATLKARQIKFLSCFLASDTITEACEFANIQRSTFYRWMKHPEFRAAVRNMQNTMISEGVLNLKNAFARAVEKVVSAKDSFQQQKYIIDANLKMLELELRRKTASLPVTEQPVSPSDMEPAESEEKEVLDYKERSRHWV